jgi:hypothetical protein
MTIRFTPLRTGLSDEKEPALIFALTKPSTVPIRSLQWQVHLSDLGDQDLERFRRGCDLGDAPAYRRDHEHRPDWQKHQKSHFASSSDFKYGYLAS